MEFKRLEKTLKRQLLILFIFLLLNSCAHVVLKDSEWCGDEGDLGAACFHTFSNEGRVIERVDWDSERFGMICTKAQNFADWKTAILQLCSQTKNCTHEDIQVINRLALKADLIMKLTLHQ